MTFVQGQQILWVMDSHYKENYQGQANLDILYNVYTAITLGQDELTSKVKDSHYEEHYQSQQTLT